MDDIRDDFENEMEEDEVDALDEEEMLLDDDDSSDDEEDEDEMLGEFGFHRTDSDEEEAEF